MFILRLSCLYRVSLYVSLPLSAFITLSLPSHSVFLSLFPPSISGISSLQYIPFSFFLNSFIFSSQLFPPSALSPFSRFNPVASDVEGSVEQSNLLRMRASNLGQSAPSLFASSVSTIYLIVHWLLHSCSYRGWIKHILSKLCPWILRRPPWPISCGLGCFLDNRQAIRQSGRPTFQAPEPVPHIVPPSPPPRADASALGLLLTNSAQRWRCRGKERREVASMLQAPSIEENAHYYITFVIGIHWNIFLPSINESRDEVLFVYDFHFSWIFLLIVAYPTILFIYMLYHYFCIVFSFEFLLSCFPYNLVLYKAIWGNNLNLQAEPKRNIIRNYVELHIIS